MIDDKQPVAIEDNVAVLLHATAQRDRDGLAIAEPLGLDSHSKRVYRQISFSELDDDSTCLSDGLRSMGAVPGMRLALLVRPGIDFISLVFAMFKAGIVIILIDPGMGRKNLIRCLADAEPKGFVAISMVQAVRTLMRRRFREARLNVTVGRRWFWGGRTLEQLRARSVSDLAISSVSPNDPAAIIFTTGSTGPPKGVLYRHGNFTSQARQIQQFYGIAPGEIDLPGFPLFALFNCAMGVSTIIPKMDPTRPADVEPRNIVDAVNDWQVTQAFGSPALWNVVGAHCQESGDRMPSLRRVLSAGAPVPPHVVKSVRQAIHSEGDIHTPYGATEALPVASISGSEVLRETESHTAAGKGTCVGKPFSEIQWKVIKIRDSAISDVSEVEELGPGEIGELMVCGPVVTRQYVTRIESNEMHKVTDGDNVWHRMGDVGYLDQTGRFWFCGRKAHRLQTADGPMYTVMCEAVFNEHPSVYRSALVGMGDPSRQSPVIIVEPWPQCRPNSADDKKRLLAELRQIALEHEHTRSIEHFLIHPSLPVDIRHNAKIFREQLGPWAARRIVDA